jgi:hypothetical protein
MWFKDLFEQGKIMKLDMSPAVKEVYSRMLATQEEIDAARGAENLTSTRKRAFEPDMPTSQPGEAVTVADIKRKILDMIPVRHGLDGKRPRGVLGFFKNFNEVIRTKFRNDLPVIMHELGHALDKQLGLRAMKGNGQAEIELMMAGAMTAGKGYSREQIRNEGIAQFFQFYAINGTQARQEFPEFTKLFESALEAHPELRRQVLEVRDMVRAYYKQDSKARILASIRSATDRPPETLKERAERLWTSFYENWIDSNIRLKEVSEQVREQLGLEHLPDELNLAGQAQTSAGYQGRADRAVTGFLNVIRRAGLKAEDRQSLRAYMAAARSQNYRANDLIPGLGMSPEEEQQIIDGTPQRLKDIARQLREQYQKTVGDTLVRSGIMTEERWQELQERWPDYVPFIRMGDDGDGDITRYLRGKKLVDLPNPIKRATGVADEAEIFNIRDPLESMLSNIVAFHQLAAKQDIAQTIRNIADLEGFGWMAERLDGAPDSDDNTFYLWNKGKKEYYATDPDVYRVLKGLNRTSGWGSALPIFNTMSNILKMGATRYNPAFIVTNIIRDAVGAAINSESWSPPLVATIRGAFMLVNGRRGGKWAGLIDEIVNENVFYSGITEILRNAPEDIRVALDRAFRERNPAQRVLDILMDWANILGAINETSEVGPKVYEYYYLTRRQGMPKKEVARRAREVNLDFQRAGAQGRELNRMTAFFNAAVQGIDKTARTARERPGQTAAKTMMYVVLPSILAWMLAHMDDDKEKEYNEIPNYIKDRYWVVKAGDKWVRIPKPQQIGLIGSLVERSLDWGMENKPAAMRGYLRNLADEFTPNLLPTLLSPWLEVWANHSTFTGRPVVPRSKENLPAEMQYGPETSGLAKVAGGALGVSPYNVDHVIRNTTGTLGGDLVKAPDRFIGDRNREEEQWTEKPFVRSFFVNPYRNSESLDRFYELARQTQVAQNGYKENLKAGSRGTVSKDLRLAPMFSKAMTAMREFRNTRSQIQQSDRSPALKRKRWTKSTGGGGPRTERAEGVRWLLGIRSRESIGTELNGITNRIIRKFY